jgi:uncharacterized protein YbjQ (UPF0145 family)
VTEEAAHKSYGVVVVTTDEIPGYRVSAILGTVVGVASHSSSPFGEGLKSVDTGKSVSAERRVEVMRKSREEAIDVLAWHARRLGANAVVAMRFDHRMVTDAWNEICAYGTAVQVVGA